MVDNITNHKMSHQSKNVNGNIKRHKDHIQTNIKVSTYIGKSETEIK